MSIQSTLRRLPEEQSLGSSAVDAFRIDADTLEVGQIIGTGAFGTVRRARWQSTPVAVKVLFHDSTVDDWDMFKKEIRLMSQLHHPNIAQFLGWAHVPGLALVVELFERGSLEAYVPRDRPGLKASLSFCVDMARAVEYLHGRRPKIVVHRDIKPPNFLVSKCLRIKLGDFGIARNIGVKKAPSPDASVRELPEGNFDGSTRRGPSRADSFGTQDGGTEDDTDNELTTECGTARFMAPEVASPSQGASGKRARYGHAVDVFSLSLVFYFVWERKLPAIAGVTNVEEHRNAIEAGGRPQFSRTPRVIRDLIRDMWSLFPEDRVSASEVCERLERCSVKSNLRSSVVLAKPPGC